MAMVNGGGEELATELGEKDEEWRVDHHNKPSTKRTRIN
jgi:hypothetical protein